jgi:hypothetical protein
MLASKSGASEEQMAVDIPTTPHTILCIAAPNGNRLARQEEEWKPRWLKRTAFYIADFLAKTSQRACVFVGDASLCPGVSNPVAYTKLVVMFQEALRALGVALVSTCPGVILQDDGIHWDIRSEMQLSPFFFRTSFFANRIKLSSPNPLWQREDT